MSAEMKNVLHVVGVGVQKLRADLAGAERRASMETAHRESLARQLDRALAEEKRLRDEVSHLAVTVKKFEHVAPKHAANLRTLDSLQLGLWDLIEHVQAATNNAKTTAEAKALGRVLAELQELYGPRADGKPW